MLGGWCDLLANANHLSWIKALHHAWPHGTRRDDVHNTAQRLRTLRNRIFHHEPLLNRPLNHVHEDLLAAINQLSPDLYAWVLAGTHVPNTLAARLQ